MPRDKPEGKDFYRRLKRAFEDASDAEIARRLHVTPQSVSQWKGGKTIPEGGTLIYAAQVTGIRMEWFLSGDESFFTTDSSMRPHSGREHDRIAAVIDSEFKRVANEEGVVMQELVADVARYLGIPERNIYNYRTGKWSVPASIISPLSIRFRSSAILEEVLGQHVTKVLDPLLRGLGSQLKDASHRLP